MLYLTQALFLPWLLAALLLGAAVGWRTASRMPRLAGLGWLGAGLGIFTFGLFLAGALALPGRWGLWLDTALHFLFWYIVGCAIGSLMSAVGAQDGAAEPVAAWAKPVRAEGPAAAPPAWTMPGWIRPTTSGGAVSGPVPALEAARAWLKVLRENASHASPGVPAWMKPTASAAEAAPVANDDFRPRWPAAQDETTSMAGWVRPNETPGPKVAAAAANEDSGARWPSRREPDAVPAWAKPIAPAAEPIASAAETAAPVLSPAPAAAKPKAKAARIGQWQASRTAEGVTLTGAVADEKSRTSLLAEAKSQMPSLAITDGLQIGAAPSDLGNMATAALGHLARLDRGIASVVDGSYTLTGSAAAGDRDAVLAAVKTLPKGYRLAHVDLATTAAQAMATAGDMAHEGERPPGLAAPRSTKADDLKRVRGIGRQNESRLNGLGIFHFDQIASWTPRHALWVGSYLAFPGRIEREDWVGQAKQLATGADTDFSKRVDKGLVATSKR